MQKGPQETIKLPPGAQIFLAHLAFFLMRDHCAKASGMTEQGLRRVMMISHANTDEALWGFT